MSYSYYQILCEKCNSVFNVPFGVVGTTVIAQPPERCPKCNGDKLRNLEMFPRTRKELIQ